MSSTPSIRRWGRLAVWLGGLLICATIGLAQPARATTITIVNNDGANEGFNDSTAYTPTGGNTATTLGQARLNVFNAAAAVWAAKISSSVPILVDSQFNPLTCSTSSAVLGQAGATNFGRLSGDAYLYPVALLSARSGKDVDTSESDITAVFNSNLGQSGCLPSNSFYYGLDHKANAAKGQIDFLSVVTHEFGHGLGFISLVDPSTGASQDTSGGYFSSFDAVLFDETTQQLWTKDTVAQRKAVAISKSSLTFSGTSTVTAAAAYLTAGKNTAGRPLMYAPATVSSGSSVSHWDTSATPNLLLEPNYNTDTPNLDLTPCALKDAGWTLLTTACLDSGTSNTAPVATPQAVSTTKNKAVAVTLAATDANGDALTYTVVTQPTHGTLSGTAPSLTYTPTSGYTGTDSFTFQASDGQATSNTATVTLAIANQAPTASSQSLSATLGQALAIVLTGTDADGDALTYTVVTQPTLGTLTGTAPNLTYTPTTAGTDAFTFRVADTSGASSAVATVTITTSATSTSTGTTSTTGSSGTTGTTASTTTTPTTTATGSSGGGAFAPGLLLVLAGLGWRRRKR